MPDVTAAARILDLSSLALMDGNGAGHLLSSGCVFVIVEAWSFTYHRAYLARIRDNP